MTLCPKCKADWDVVAESLAESHSTGDYILAQHLIDGCSCCRAHFRGEMTFNLTRQDLVALVRHALEEFCPGGCPYGHGDYGLGVSQSGLEKFVVSWWNKKEED